MNKIGLMITAFLISFLGFVSADVVNPGQVEIPRDNNYIYFLIPAVAIIIFITVLLLRRRKK